MYAARVFMLATVVVLAVLAEVGAQAKGRSAVPLGALNDDPLGESLKEFRSRHKEAECRRRPSGESDGRALKARWFTWVDCGFEHGVTFMGVETLAQANPSLPFGMFATFHDKRLVELSYTFEIQAVSSLYPALVSKLGQPTQHLHGTEGRLESATWTAQEGSLTLELVTMSFFVDGQFLHFRAGVSPVRSAKVTIYLKELYAGGDP